MKMPIVSRRSSDFTTNLKEGYGVEMGWILPKMTFSSPEEENPRAQHIPEN
jgi:hypothetical protein